MLIAYLTPDEVNHDLGLRLAEECNATLFLLSPWDAPPDGLDALLIDWDQVPAERRQEISKRLLSNPVPGFVAMHTYNPEGDDASALRERGVAVYRRLEPALFLDLCRATGRSPDARRSDSGREDEPSPSRPLPTPLRAAS